ncbi:hypothetical protein A0H81_10184 [Grifola frondosa]|uniref:Uncharacterized protein n=1 Tax=Grifola frondosa TaxID=5627 RepID=A0A1C7M4E1_GRIFR|nr:hypothetical protein A0H81_10184 [Grifola frondosa]
MTSDAGVWTSVEDEKLSPLVFMALNSEELLLNAADTGVSQIHSTRRRYVKIRAATPFGWLDVFEFTQYVMSLDFYFLFLRVQVPTCANANFGIPQPSSIIIHTITPCFCHSMVIENSTAIWVLGELKKVLRRLLWKITLREDGRTGDTSPSPSQDNRNKNT